MKTVIEETAIALAAEYWEQVRMIGLYPQDPKTKRVFKNQRKFVKAKFELFVPLALERLTQMLGEDRPEWQKKEIYEALIHRANAKIELNGEEVSHLITDGKNGSQILQ